MDEGFCTKIEGSLTGVIHPKSGKLAEKTVVHAVGCLRPDRLINIAQYHQGEQLGGVSFQIQVPLPAGVCFNSLPPTETQVVPEKLSDRSKECQETAKNLIECLGISSNDVCSVKLRSAVVEVKFKQDDDCY